MDFPSLLSVSPYINWVYLRSPSSYFREIQILVSNGRDRAVLTGPRLLQVREGTDFQTELSFAFQYCFVFVFVLFRSTLSVFWMFSSLSSAVGAIHLETSHP